MRRFLTAWPVAQVLLVALFLEVLVDVTSVAHAIFVRDTVLLPGAVARAVLMGSLGWLAIIRRSRTAGRVFAGVEFATAGACLLFALFTVPGGRLTFEVGPLGAAIGYLLIGLAVLLCASRVSGKATSEDGGPA